jgi:hypothetical protein
MAIITLNNNSLSSVTSLPAGVGGKVLQVVGVSASGSTTTSSTSFVDTALTASITPSSSSNKILITTSQNAEVNGATSGFLNLERNTTNLGTMAIFQSANGTKNVAYSYIDSPSTTSAIQYTVQVRTNNVGISVTHNANNPNASIILMEIEA